MTSLKLQFGQIPFWAICRFGERSKIEIMVFSFICAKRFRSTEEAECSRAEIMEHTNLDKSQISVAITKLIKANWLEAKSKTKWFVPELEPPKVEKSTTNTVENNVDDSTTFVDDSTTTVDDSTTFVDDSSTPYIRNLTDTDLRQTDRQEEELPETGEPTPVKKSVVKKISPEKKPPRIDKDFENVASLCFAMNSTEERRLMSTAQRMQIIQTLKYMREANCDLSKIPKFAEWWQMDWRSKSKTGVYQPPSPQKVRENWFEAMKSDDLTEQRLAKVIEKNGENINAVVKKNFNQPTDAGTRNAQRINNSKAAIAELRRQGLAELENERKALSC